MPPLAPRGGNDKVNTPKWLAEIIVNHFHPTGRILEPCKGGGVFVDLLACDWYEIGEGKDFLKADGYWDWVVTNPPWSKFRPFLVKSMQVADNIVFLSLINAFFMKARLADIERHGFAIKEILRVPQPPKPWPQTGFALGATHLQKGYLGDIRFT